ncbi:MAG: imidazole glycerol phosphate synthase subunit HisH [Acidobacteria bacterium]|nr:imidazole glycerol phosphate synthase subunit HisH [Acidobacteriota bacterium]
MIALVDYGAGNLTSVKKALTSLGAEFMVPDAPHQCADAAGLIVPGVGHFAATAALDASWREAIAGAVGAGTPLLGICVGMQWLYEGSEEAPEVPGLGLVPGRCRRLRGDAARRLKIPHVGWNALEVVRGANPSGSPGEPPPHRAGVRGGDPGERLAPRESRLLRGIPSGAHVYFTHSYAAPVTADCVASTTHAEPFAAAVERDLVFGVQFHPEKSGDTGLRILRNFLGMCQC